MTTVDETKTTHIGCRIWNLLLQWFELEHIGKNDSSELFVKEWGWPFFFREPFLDLMLKDVFDHTSVTCSPDQDAFTSKSHFRYPLHK